MMVDNCFAVQPQKNEVERFPAMNLFKKTQDSIMNTMVSPLNKLNDFTDNL